MRLSDGKAPNPDPTNLLVGSGLERLEDAAGTDFQDPPVESGLERLEAVVRTDMQNPPIESSPERLEGAVGTISTQDPVRSGLERPDNAAKTTSIQDIPLPNSCPSSAMDWAREWRLWWQTASRHPEAEDSFSAQGSPQATNATRSTHASPSWLIGCKCPEIPGRPSFTSVWPRSCKT